MAQEDAAEAADSEAAGGSEEESRRLAELEEEANAAEAAHEALRRAPHDPMETAREVRRLASQVSGVRVDFFATAEGTTGAGAAEARRDGRGDAPAARCVDRRRAFLS